MKRLSAVCLLLFALLSVHSQTRVVAHRGYWTVDGCVENTLASLRNAAEAKVWGSEFDVWDNGRRCGGGSSRCDEG